MEGQREWNWERRKGRLATGDSRLGPSLTGDPLTAPGGIDFPALGPSTPQSQASSGVREHLHSMSALQPMQELLHKGAGTFLGGPQGMWLENGSICYRYSVAPLQVDLPIQSLYMGGAQMDRQTNRINRT